MRSGTSVGRRGAAHALDRRVVQHHAEAGLFGQRRSRSSPGRRRPPCSDGAPSEACIPARPRSAKRCPCEHAPRCNLSVGHGMGQHCLVMGLGQGAYLAKRVKRPPPHIGPKIGQSKVVEYSANFHIVVVRPPAAMGSRDFLDTPRANTPSGGIGSSTKNGWNTSSRGTGRPNRPDHVAVQFEADVDLPADRVAQRLNTRDHVLHAPARVIGWRSAWNRTTSRAVSRRPRPMPAERRALPRFRSRGPAWCGPGLARGREALPRMGRIACRGYPKGLLIGLSAPAQVHAPHRD